MPFVATTWINLENIILSEDRERQLSYGITYMQNLKKKNYTSKLYLQNINRLTELTDLQNKSMVSRGKGRGEDWEFGIDM